MLLSCKLYFWLNGHKVFLPWTDSQGWTVGVNVMDGLAWTLYSQFNLVNQSLIYVQVYVSIIYVQVVFEVNLYRAVQWPTYYVKPTIHSLDGATAQCSLYTCTLHV